MMSRPTNLRLDDQLCFALYAATNTVTRAYRPLLEKIGLTYPQYLVMMVLWQDAELAVHEIAARLKLAPHAVSPLIGRLERAGLVVRQRAAPDRRVVQVHLTGAGADLESAAAEAQHSVVCQTELSSPELADLRAALHQLIAAMDVDAGGPAIAPHPSSAARSPKRTSITKEREAS